MLPAQQLFGPLAMLPQVILAGKLQQAAGAAGAAGAPNGLLGVRKPVMHLHLLSSAP